MAGAWCLVVIVYLIVVFDTDGFFAFGCGYGKVPPQDNVVSIVDCLGREGISPDFAWGYLNWKSLAP